MVPLEQYLCFAVQVAQGAQRRLKIDDGRVAEGVLKSSSSAPQAHRCTLNCTHHLLRYRKDVTGKAKNEICAAAHLLREAEACGKTHGGSSKNPSETDNIVLCVFVHDDIMAGSTQGLTAATGRLLGVTSDRLQGAMKKENARGDDGSALKRSKRADAFDLELVYNYFHHIEGFTQAEKCCVDFSPLVEPAKSKTTEWKDKKWDAPWSDETLHLKCKPHVRRAILSELSECFMNSETHRA